jgi:DUF1009 family protein
MKLLPGSYNIEITATATTGQTLVHTETVVVTAEGVAGTTQLLSRLIDLNLWTAGSNGIVRGNDKAGVL